jgi:hypothetical protein
LSSGTVLAEPPDLPVEDVLFLRVPDGAATSTILVLPRPGCSHRTMRQWFPVAPDGGGVVGRAFG